MQILQINCRQKINKIMHDIGVDPYGIKIMLPKATNFLIRLNSISHTCANILKQEMLSSGGDAAIARGAITGKLKKTDCLLIGNLAQINSLIKKLKLQPFGLHKIARELDINLRNYTKNDYILPLRDKTLNLSARTHIMGIINMTPDSFSGDGLYGLNSKDNLNLAFKKAQNMAKDGADIIDVGGQSSRPGAKNISAKEELKRVIPLIKLLTKKIKTPLSIDTTKTEVAHAALQEGAQIINDISGLRGKQMLKLAAKSKAAVVIMHILGKPVNMQKIIKYSSLIDDIANYLKKAIDSAQSAGINPNRIIIDPGIGFGKTYKHNFEIIKRLSEFKSLGKPILVGPSKKSFIAKILGEDFKSRAIGTLATNIMAIERGANILRVHDVKETFQALKILNTVRQSFKKCQN